MEHTISDPDAQAVIQIWSHLARAAEALTDWAGRDDEDAELRVRTSADHAVSELERVIEQATALADRVRTEAADWDVEQSAVLDALSELVGGDDA